jgi:hypothetical protein
VQGGCQVGPRAGCLEPIAAFASKLIIYNKPLDAGDLVTWKWSKGAATTLADFGNPIANTDYTLCVFDQSGLALRATAPAGGTCVNASCWTKLGAIGFKYIDKERTPDGVLRVLVKSGLAGRAKAQFKAQGFNLRLPPFVLPLDPPVVAQLQAAGAACWQTTHSTHTIQRNDASQFKAKSD